MVINWDLNAGTALTALIAFGGILWRFHTWDKSNSVRQTRRHLENQSRMEAIETKTNMIDVKVDEGRIAMVDIRRKQEECWQAITDANKQGAETRERVARVEATVDAMAQANTPVVLAPLVRPRRKKQ